MTKGYSILVKGAPRTFRDRRETAHDAARVIKSRWPNDRIEIVDEASGNKQAVLPDGRMS
jgi:hypothetical protein